MITYTSGGAFFILKLVQMNGSVFPSSILVAFPCASISAALRLLINLHYLDYFQSTDSILSETQAWSGFSFLVGFLIVFRTSQAYSRFWDGCTATHQMRAEWFDACSALVAFCKYSKADNSTILRFKNTLVRLFSMLHAAALAELEEMNIDIEKIDDIDAFSFNLIDPAGIDLTSLKTIKMATSKVELIFSWIQFLIVENIETGVLAIPPPILSRSFQEIANGMIAFHDAVKISYIPFPFPYAQTCDFLLVLHFLVVPFVTAQWVSKPEWAFIFVFIQVFILWSLNFIAVEIENPFGTDANDLDGRHMQAELNRHLLLLLSPVTTRTPWLVESACKCETTAIEDIPYMSFIDIWQTIGDGGAAPVLAARIDATFARAFQHPEEHTFEREDSISGEMDDGDRVSHNSTTSKRASEKRQSLSSKRPSRLAPAYRQGAHHGRKSLQQLRGDTNSFISKSSGSTVGRVVSCAVAPVGGDEAPQQDGAGTQSLDTSGTTPCDSLGGILQSKRDSLASADVIGAVTGSSQLASPSVSERYRNVRSKQDAVHAQV